jgi:LPXTG-motif cell wall-anchored protein
MYGMNTALPASGAAVGATGLAYTGLDVMSALLTALGVMLIGMALLGLVRRDNKARP